MPTPDGSLSPATLSSPGAAAPGGSPSKRPPAALKAVDTDTTAGIIFGIGAYGLWGLMPLYFFLLQPAGAVEIVANRVLWSLIFCVLLITITRSWRVLGAAFRNRTVIFPLIIAAVLIAVNWLTYVYGVTTGQAVEASLGYFINPLVSVLLGVVVLKEKLRPLQWAAVGIGFVAVGVLTVSYGKLPLIALTLALSFGLYGFVKKRIGPSVDAVSGLTLESAWLAPVAGVLLVIVASTTGMEMGQNGAVHAVLLSLAGVVTAIPLLLFASGARRVSLTTMGMLQFVAPILQFIIGAWLLGEEMSPARWVGFGLVWVALTILTIDSIRHARTSRGVSDLGELT